MSEALGVKTETTVWLSAEKIVKLMDETDVASFCSAVAERFDSDFPKRAEAAAAFADGLSEQGCRFLAEVIASHWTRRG